MDTTPQVAPTAPAESVPAHEPLESQSPATEGQSAESSSSEPQSEAPQPPKPSRLQQRIDDLTRQRYEEQRRADDAHARLAAFERQNAQAQQFAQIDAQMPRIEQFDNLHAYQVSMSQWTQAKAVAIATSQWEERMQQMTAHQAQQAARVQEQQHHVMRENILLEQRMGEATKVYPDFVKVVTNPDLPTVRGTPLFAAVMESDNAPQIAYSLAKNPAELDRLLALRDPVKITREVMKLDAKFTGNAATQAPPPPPQRNGATASSRNWGEMSTAEHVKAYREAKAKRR